jgi:hypothetical protein
MVKIGKKKAGIPLTYGQYAVDRTSPLGNPYPMTTKSSEERDKVCDAYDEYFQREILGKRPKRAWEYLCMLLERALTGDVELMCWCHPQRCHAETIKSWLDEQVSLERQREMISAGE